MRAHPVRRAADEEMPVPTDEEYRQWAIDEYQNDDVQIDADARISLNDAGAWVAAWVFVYNRHTEEDSPMETCVECGIELDPQTDPFVCFHGIYVHHECEKDAFGTPNEHALEGMRCPTCGSYEPFRIAVTTTVIQYDDGTDEDTRGGHQAWGTDSDCECDACRHAGSVKDFLTPDYTIAPAPRRDNSPRTPLHIVRNDDREILGIYDTHEAATGFVRTTVRAILGDEVPEGGEEWDTLWNCYDILPTRLLHAGETL